MTAIVMNTATGAVTEYDWTFQSVSPTRAGSAAAGLATLGGANDAGAPIAAQFLTGKPGGERLLGLGNVYVALEASGDCMLIVQGRATSWEYPVALRGSGVARVKPGRGISESRLGLGFRNVAGADFKLDRINPEVTEAKSRRF